MNRYSEKGVIMNRVLGLAIFILSIVGFVFYAYLLFASDFSMLVLKITVLVLVALVIAMLSFIGLNIAIAKKE
ncbi:MAG: hypothetical protein QW416_06140 [Candidatus Nitrosocaldaceae archaeon]